MAGFFKRLLGWGSNSYREVTDNSIDRGNYMFVAPQDARVYLTAFTREKVAEKAEWARQNFGIVQEWGRGVARHSVGRGIVAQFNTPDTAWNKAAGLAVEHYMLSPSMCDITGRRNGYEQQLWLAEQYVILGESFSAILENEQFPSPRDGIGACPAFFNIAPADVRKPRVMPDNVPIHDGIELSPLGSALKYHVRTFQDEFTAYEAADMCHLFEPFGAHQSRGLSTLAPGLNNLIDVHELKRLETRVAKAHRLLALVIKGTKAKKTRGIVGAIERAASGNGNTDSTSADTAAMEKIYGGAGAAIARLGEDGSAELLTSNSPSPLIREYITDLLLRDGSAAIGVPVEFFWSPEKLGGANVRGIYARADATFQLIADKIIYRFYEPLIIRFLRWRIASGLLPEPPGGINGPWLDQITYRRPRRVTVDNGRDSAARIAALNSGLANLRGLYDEEGEDWMPQTEQWVDEFRIFREICKARGFSDAETAQMMARWRPLPPGSAPAQNAEQKPDPQNPDNPTDEPPGDDRKTDA